MVFQNLCKSWWTPRDRPFRFQNFPSSSSLFLLETRSIQQRQGCFSNVLDLHKRICFSPIFSNKQSFTQSFDRSSDVNFVNTSMANLVLVLSLTKTLDWKLFDFSQSSRFLTRPKQETSSSNNNRKSASHVMVSFRESLSSEKISRESATFITNARQVGTITHYESSRHKWYSWCVRKKIYPIKCPLTGILDIFYRVLLQRLSIQLQDLGL